MKKICLKSYVIPILVTLICSTIYLHNTKNEIIYETKKIIKTANVLKTIEEENTNNTLIKENKFNDIKYLLYSENDNLKSYFVDEKIDEITDIYSIIKKDCKNNFDAKINEFLNITNPRLSDIFERLPDYFLDKTVTCNYGRNILIESIGERKIIFDTIHGVKGETHDATLYLETEIYNSSDLKRIIQLINGENTIRVLKEIEEEIGK